MRPLVLFPLLPPSDVQGSRNCGAPCNCVCYHSLVICLKTLDPWLTSDSLIACSRFTLADVDSRYANAAHSYPSTAQLGLLLLGLPSLLLRGYPFPSFCCHVFRLHAPAAATSFDTNSNRRSIIRELLPVARFYPGVLQNDCVFH